jgi:thiazole tautomerase (transcriptional regulator TenI)
MMKPITGLNILAKEGLDLTRPELHLITTGKQTLADVSSRIKKLSKHAIQAIDVFHIREKHRTAREYMEWFNALRELLPDVRIVVNDRADVAFAIQADGVQLAWHSIGVDDARMMLPATCQVGCSVHNTDEAIKAQNGGADFVLFGHVFATTSKPGLEPRGVDLLKQVVRSVTIPVIALGGISSQNIERLSVDCGAGVAIMSAFFTAQDADTELIKIRNELDKRRL